MTDAEAVLRQARAWLDEGRGVALATVVRTWGSAPCPPGSLLAVNDRTEFTGSVSGGCVETAVVQESLAAIGDGKHRVLSYGVASRRAFEAGLGCGGTIEILVQRIGSRALLDAAVAALEARRASVLATDLGTGESRLLDVEPAGGSGPLLAAAREAARADASGVVVVQGARVLLRVFQRPVQLAVVGAVHVAQALAPMARLAGLDVVVVDPRGAFATAQRFPDTRLVPEWPAEAFARIGLDRRTAVVTLSHDPKIDDPALAAALRSDAFYVGALGSRRTQAARRARLREAGFSEQDVARIHGPVGLAIGAVTPSEIAVSVLAEIVSCVREARRERAASGR